MHQCATLTTGVREMMDVPGAPHMQAAVDTVKALQEELLQIQQRILSSPRSERRLGSPSRRAEAALMTRIEDARAGINQPNGRRPVADTLAAAREAASGQARRLGEVGAQLEQAAQDAEAADTQHSELLAALKAANASAAHAIADKDSRLAAVEAQLAQAARDAEAAGVPGGQGPEPQVPCALVHGQIHRDAPCTGRSAPGHHRALPGRRRRDHSDAGPGSRRGHGQRKQHSRRGEAAAGQGSQVGGRVCAARGREGGRGVLHGWLCPP